MSHQHNRHPDWGAVLAVIVVGLLSVLAGMLERGGW